MVMYKFAEMGGGTLSFSWKLPKENYPEILDPIFENTEDEITKHYLISNNGLQLTTVILYV